MKYIIVFFILFNPFCALSQSNYHKGSVTINNGNVLTGYIDYRDWVMNPQSINFKTNLDDKGPTVYHPASIQFFTIDDLERYNTYKGRVSINKINFPDLPYGKDTSNKFATVFLRLITTGNNVSLFSYTDAVKTRFFISEKNEEPYELAFQRYYEDGSTVVRTDRKYTGQLIYLINKYVQSDTRLFEKAENASYEEDDIINMVNTINGTVKTNAPKRLFNDKESSFRLYAGAAVSIANSVFHNEMNLENAHCATQTPQVNFGFDIFTNPTVQKFIFRFDVGLGYINTVFKGQRAATTASLSPYTVNATYTYHQYNLKITPQVIYNFYNTNAVKIYIDGGLVINMSQYSNQTYTTYSSAGSSFVSPTTNNVPYHFENEWVTFSCQTGIVFNKRIEAYFNYNLPSSYASYVGGTGLAVSTTYYNAGIHYLFGKANHKIQ